MYCATGMMIFWGFGERHYAVGLQCSACSAGCNPSTAILCGMQPWVGCHTVMGLMGLAAQGLGEQFLSHLQSRRDDQLLFYQALLFWQPARASPQTPGPLRRGITILDSMALLATSLAATRHGAATGQNSFLWF